MLETANKAFSISRPQKSWILGCSVVVYTTGSTSFDFSLMQRYGRYEEKCDSGFGSFCGCIMYVCWY